MRWRPAGSQSPLAIELAAARLRAISVTEVASRLDDRFRLLAGRGGTHDRHATLQATLDSSFDLLDAEERVPLSRLSSPAASSSPRSRRSALSTIDANAVLYQLLTLDDKPRVIAVDAGAATRYTTLEAVRAYAAEQLAARDETEILYERPWAVDRGHADIALGVAAGLARGWIFTGGAVEAQRRCEQALALDGGDTTARSSAP